VADRRHGNTQVGQDLQRFGGDDDLGLDARRCEEHVEHGAGLVLGDGNEARRREPGDGLLFQDGLRAVIPTLEVVDQAFGVSVARDRDDEVDVPGESRFGPGRDREPSHQHH
jgi:hypothetical protein